MVFEDHASSDQMGFLSFDVGELFLPNFGGIVGLLQVGGRGLLVNEVVVAEYLFVLEL